ncbi:dihydroxyacetone kinase subunit DhaL [Thermomonospora umbrina]|uniref:Dihydroxyacetone kinase DhaL subunit n=1 Tax=Thermomonospora umbrina TaxID=111806 RepID=A0A3D9T0A1_9ACTN|nr:dihydroxyacetone kinase subunit DhaL [Thermomonospora umbrina]REE98234.1 dihydroxyacetone kinase DhaL subunit [Thermomonospora umbrina]
MNGNEFAAWIRRAAELVTADAQRLTALDAAIGDGDHGLNMARGFGAAVAALDALPEDATPGTVLTTAGRAIVSKTGGASGPLYGTALRRAGKALGDVADVDVTGLAGALQAALDGVRELGRAVEGDKTMVDALAPAVAAFEASVADGDALAEAAQAAVDAGEAGMELTVPMEARKGRASYLGPRSIGHLDPGAASTVLVLLALLDVARAEV